MAQFDLKKATIHVLDAYGLYGGPTGGLINLSMAGAINNVSGYTAGAATIAVDGFTGIIPVGASFVITGDSTKYTVTAHSETLGNTTSVTFTPVLAADVADDAVVTVSGYGIGATVLVVDGFTDAVAVGDTLLIGSDTTIYTVTAHSETLSATTSVTVTPGLADVAADDATATIQPHSVEIKLVDGTLSFTEKQARVYVKNRGLLSTVRNGDDDPVEVKTNFMWEFYKSQSGQSPTIDECFKQTGGAADWVSTDSDQCAPYAVDILVNYNPNCNGIYTEQITLPVFRWEELMHDAKQGVIDLTGKCNVKTATSARTAAA